MNRMNHETFANAAPSFGGGFLAFLGGLSANDLAAGCGAAAAMLGMAYTAWRWRRDIRVAAREDADRKAAGKKD